MSVKLLTEHHLELLTLKEDCTGPSESTQYQNVTLLKITWHGPFKVTLRICDIELAHTVEEIHFDNRIMLDQSEPGTVDFHLARLDCLSFKKQKELFIDEKPPPFLPSKLRNIYKQNHQWWWFL